MLTRLRIALSLFVCCISMAANAASPCAPQPVAKSELEEGCTLPSKPIQQQILRDGTTLFYVPFCTHGANSDYELVAFDKHCSKLPLHVETLGGDKQLHMYDPNITCDDLKFKKNDDLVCNEAGASQQFLTNFYHMDGSILRLQQIIATDMHTDTATTQYQRKP